MDNNRANDKVNENQQTDAKFKYIYHGLVGMRVVDARSV